MTLLSHLLHELALRSSIQFVLSFYQLVPDLTIIPLVTRTNIVHLVLKATYRRNINQPLKLLDLDLF
jgi:hypothetical protein